VPYGDGGGIVGGIVAGICFAGIVAGVVVWFVTSEDGRRWW
jgi:hypothetical protein